MNIADALYSINDRYLCQQDKTTKAGGTSIDNVERTAEGGRDQAGADAYQVTLSPQVEYAKTREGLGLPVSGKLRLDDFKTAMDRDGAAVRKSIKSVSAELGLDPDLKVTLSLDDNGRIVSAGSFGGQKVFEEALNKDQILVQSFRRLAANHDVVQYITTSQRPSIDLNLLAAMEGDDSQDMLPQIARQYEAFRSTINPLETLLQFSRTAEPYRFTYDPGED